MARWLVLLALLGSLAACGEEEWPPASRAATTSAPPFTLVSAPATVNTALSVAPSVVRVRAVGCEGDWTGSGFLVAPGVIATNRHVVDDTRSITVTFIDGRERTVTRAERVLTADLGLLTLSNADGLPEPLRLSEAPARAGDTVIVHGYPLGGALTKTEGSVIGADDDGSTFPSLQLSALVRPGSSGGPVTRPDGQVVAVVAALERIVDVAVAVPVDALAEALTHDSVREPARTCSP